MATVNIDRLLDAVIKQQATDLHLAVGRKPTLRIRNKLVELNTKTLEPSDTVAVMQAIAPERSQAEIQEQGGSDFSYTFGSHGRFRVSIYRVKSNLSIAMRLVPTKPMSLDEIQLPEMVKELCRRPSGLFLVTGPTGCGKSTTAASMIDYINENFDRHIITVEDPVEYHHAHKKSIVNQREVGRDVPSFAEALRRGLRQSADVFLIGELRDQETMELAIRAAETGMLVFATMHTSGAAGTINRIVESFPPELQNQIRIQMSTSLIAVVSQQLLPRVNKRGMVAAFEFMVVTPGIANIIRDGKTFRIDSAIQTGRKYGMQLLDDHLWTLLTQGIISAEDFVDKARDANSAIHRLKQAGMSVTRTGMESGEAEE